MWKTEPFHDIKTTSKCWATTVASDVDLHTCRLVTLHVNLIITYSVSECLSKRNQPERKFSARMFPLPSEERK